MADIRSPVDDVAPELRDLAINTPIDRTTDTPPPPGAASDKGSAMAEGSAPEVVEEDRDATAAAIQPPPAGHQTEIGKHVDTVLKSEIGISTLLTRLKQSIGSAREFGLFLKKRATLEEDNASGLKKVCRSTQDSMRRPDHRTGTFSHAYDELIYIHERMAENGSQFAVSLHQMHDDLVELAANAERSRKHWKTTGLAAEQKVVDLDNTVRKSKAKYDSLADEYERAKTGEGSKKVFNAFKNKSAAQQEEDLLKKVQTADQTYRTHVSTLQTEKAQLETSIRPEAVKTLQDLIREVDSGLGLQMQKFASFSEKLLLSNGISISPINGPAGEKTTRSLRHAVMSVDDEADLQQFVSAHINKVPAGIGEVKYERNLVLQPQQSPLSQAPPQIQVPPQSTGISGGPPQSSGGPAPPSPQQSSGQMALGSSFGGPQGASSFTQQHGRNFSQGASPHQPTPSFGSSNSPHGPPQLGALSFQSGPPGSHFPPQSHQRQVSSPGGMPQGPSGAYRASPPPGRGHPAPSGPPAQPVFGVPLDRLYERDGLAVPLVLYQCLQAVDMFGLNVEGIYRQSGSLTHIQKLKTMFDNDSQSKALDFRNPENFFQDVNSVTGLMKQFLRDLPDPLLTSEHHDAFVAAAKHDDDTTRRDSLHAIINALPDPNYATLRALCLHLHRVIDNAHTNRMNGQNLAVIFGPTLMGTDPSKAIADAGWQIKCVNTILENTYQIFDDD